MVGAKYMTNRYAWSIVVMSFLIAIRVAAEDLAIKQIAARTELHPISSLTISDEQFLTGDKNGKPVTVTGQFRIAQGQGRLPVVVMAHGSGGMGSNVDSWTRQLNGLAISTFALDAFTGRGLTSVSNDQALLGRLNMILDVYRMLDILAKHPRVDPQRIALMGFSRGGQAALYASLKRFHQAWNKSGVDFSSYIAFYPDCMTTYQSDSEVVERPIRIFHGTADDYNPMAPCKAYVERLHSAGRDVQLTEFPNASHGFDNPLGSLKPRIAENAQTVRRCVIREDSPGRLVNTATGSNFSYKDSCVERDPHVGYDPAATQAASQAVEGLLKTVLKLN
jgi:dienelactone hydrolase